MKQSLGILQPHDASGPLIWASLPPPLDGVIHSLARPSLGVHRALLGLGVGADASQGQKVGDEPWPPGTCCMHQKVEVPGRPRSCPF